jgi:hypothetical protein
VAPFTVQLARSSPLIYSFITGQAPPAYVPLARTVIAVEMQGELTIPIPTNMILVRNG